MDRAKVNDGRHQEPGGNGGAREVVRQRRVGVRWKQSRSKESADGAKWERGEDGGSWWRVINRALYVTEQ